MNLEKQSSLTPVGFETMRKDRSYLQTRYIVELLQKSMAAGKVITKQDIIECYIDFRFNGDEFFRFVKWEGNERGYVRYKGDREWFRKVKVFENQVMQWFKSNLGSAILKGKILAIPVIDI